MGREYTREIEIRSEIRTLGETILIDEVEKVALFWDTSGTGNFLIEVDTSQSQTGPASIHIRTQTTTPGIGNSADISRNVFTRESQGIKLTAVALAITGTTGPIIQFDIISSNLSDIYEFTIRLDVNANKVTYLNSGGTFSDAPDGAGLATEGYWHQVELKVNRETGKYGKVIVNGRDIGIKGISARRLGAGTEQYVQTTIGLRTQAAASEETYIDRVLLEED